MTWTARAAREPEGTAVDHVVSAVDTHRSILEIDRDEWDAIATGNVLYTHGWLRTVEECAPALEPRYLVIRETGRVVAATMYCMTTSSDLIATPDDHLLGRLRRPATRLGIGFLPAIVSRPMLCWGSHILTGDRIDPTRRQSLIRRLLDALEEQAARKQVGLFLSGLMDREAALLAELDRRRYHRTPQFPITHLDIRWNSFEGYLGSLKNRSKRIAANIRNEINKNRRAGVRVQPIDDPRGDEGRLMELAVAHHRRRYRWPFPFRHGFFTTVARNLGDRCRIYGARRGRKLCGFSLMLAAGGVGHVVLGGVDRPRAADDRSYFVLHYDRPIIDAIAEGFTRLYFGGAPYDLKRRRGCHTSNTHLYYRASTRFRHTMIGPFLTGHAWWMHRKIAVAAPDAPARF